MSEEQKKSEKGFPGCCEGIPFADMMRKMMEAKNSGTPFTCAEMMSQMMKMCGGVGNKEKGSTPKTP